MNSILPMIYPSLQVINNDDGGFSPLDISGLAAWWLASEGTFSDTACTTPSVPDGIVAAWVDRKSAIKAEQPTVGAQPLLKTNQVNSQPALQFDGGDFLSAGDVLNLGTKSVLLYAVIQPTNIGGAHVYTGKLSPNVDDARYAIYQDGTKSAVYSPTGSSATSQFVIASAKSYALGMIIDRANSLLKFRQGGIERDSDAVMSNTSDLQTPSIAYTIGGRNATDLLATALIAEVIQCHYASTASGIAQMDVDIPLIEAYLLAKYGAI